ncbi:TLC domain-containing protein [Calycina marina]|uniref:TLC domain-containing protein n=1 Tax=Calycina marina TaxID=1763456 RepID=A0A9P7Z299_9HELO|nr:TLC domain-containing protein [Calycina marina]
MSETSNSPAPLADEHEKQIKEAHEFLHSNGNNVSAIEQKLGEKSRREKALAPPTMVIKRKHKRKDDGPMEIVCEWITEHQTGLSINLLMLLALTHLCFPRARRHTRKFFELSYYNAATGEYCSGWNDAFMVFFCITVITGLRATVMDYVLTPFAKKYGVKTTRDQTRFSEQAWLLVYLSFVWPLGMYIMYSSEYWLNLKELWTDWPNREMASIMKLYTLVQYAFWVQQYLVIHIEARRKDHWQMFTHHVVTTILIFTAYGYHQLKVANLIMCIMDVLDILLAIAKCMKYLNFGIICDYIFGFFMVTWVALRHVAYLMICYSVYADIPHVINYGCYRGRNGAITGPFPPPNNFSYLIDPFRNPEGVVCWNDGIKWGFLSALLFLQGITVMWFAMIVKVAIKVIRGDYADDIRSDDEEDYDEVNDEHILEMIDQLDESEPMFYEEEVGVEAISLKGRTSTAARYRKGAAASGVSLPRDRSDRKELLGRIGCDKPV